MSSRTRVIQWGLGNVGRHSLRGILERPDLELVGARVYQPGKVGRDVAELIGLPPCGITATDDVDAIVALDADCVLYNGLGSALIDLTEPVNDLARLLESGKNVVSSAIDAFVYLKPGLAVDHAKPELVERIRRACEIGQTSIYNTGMTPGFAIDIWPLVMSRVTRRVDSVHVTEVVNLRNYESSMMTVMGFGLVPGEPSLMHDFFRQNPAGSVYVAPMHMIADAMGAQIDTVTYDRQVTTSDEPVVTASGQFDAGTIVGIRFQFTGWVDEKPFVVLDFVWRIDDATAPDWPAGYCRWILDLEGDPSLRSSVELSTEMDAKRPTSLTVAMSCLNAVPMVMAAAPGIVEPFRVPLVAGRSGSSLRDSSVG
ncbi:4-hydroxy-tetrahydrodipicolinate reductase [Mycolicibacterium sp. BK634]|uniref:NAD(P)H-dependent amine dehydrogenase family protein n=1 Tax=Mycolicibacterium sp. BK634 TaxID=2587099 RepID=UPI00161E7DA9|nr:dihydrodipicolinate reductase [Mycolicibacterium sp. BK634]MBB3748175.1 4-hydroxy-tetrahydrodipicolinate reductase [Mycolicibacterium sp. BK634]